LVQHPLDLRDGLLCEAVGLADRANVRLFIDKQAAGGERFAVNFQQSGFFHFVF
jgi:hypothetical protein